MKDLSRAIALPELKIFKCRSSRNWIVRGPIDATAIYAYAQIGFDVTGGNFPILSKPRQLIMPVRRRRRRKNVRRRSFV